MNQFLRNLTAEQQVSALFIIVFGLLFIASATVFMLSLRERGDSVQADLVRGRLDEARALLRTSWAMTIVFWVGWASGERVATTLFAIVAFFALREFITLSPTRRGDHRSLVLAFFVVLPIQFWLVATAHFDLFTVFIPVYVFLAIPVVSALADDPNRFLERNAKLQWGIMVCVYGMSHVPALLVLDFPHWDNDKNAFLVFFLALVVQTSMVVQHLAARQLRRKSALLLRAPEISSRMESAEKATRPARKARKYSRHWKRGTQPLGVPMRLTKPPEMSQPLAMRIEPPTAISSPSSNMKGSVARSSPSGSMIESASITQIRPYCE